MAGAAGGFLTRSFESMLKECNTSKKHATVQKALQEYLDGQKERANDPSTSEKKQATKTPADTNSPDGSFVADGERKEENLLGTSSTEPSKAGELDAKTPRSNETLTSTLASAGHTLEGPELELVLKPLRLAFETKNVKLVEPALDCIHKLIAYDHLEGDPGLEGVNSGPLFTDMLDMVCGCIDNFSLDSTILQVLKVLLTAVASTKFRVHGECLLGVIRLCYNIALHSKSPINQATSKAMLTQMISIIIRRMESDQSMSSDSIIKRVTKASIPTSGANEETVDTNSEHESSTSQEASNEDQEGKRITLGDALSEDRESSKPYVNVEELEHLAGGADIKGLEAALDKAVHIENGKLMQRGIDLESMSIGEQDALLLFRTLCKMSMKEENDEVAAKTRLLSLELLQSLLEGVSETFTRNFHFIDSVKAYLSYALLRASVSSVSAVFQHATGIFTVLLLRFRESLKGEVGVFFPLIILRPLDSADSPITQKTNVLRMLEKVCKEPQTLADIFVNYDCDLEAPNLYERMVHALSKLAQGSPSGEPNSPNLSQNMSIKASALQCLVSVLKGLADWERLQREPVEISNHKLFDESSGKDNSIDDVKNRDDSGNQFEKAKAHKSTLETAISEFNRKPGKGIDCLISNKLVEKTPSSVAQFLRNTPTLDKVMVGDYLGQHEGFPLSVMHAYVDSMKFSGMKFDAAIREFLKGFRLPGEAQKIDRIMEKFAERYCADNPTLFKNPDTAYVLAYSVIMLNTDAHNPLVASKMSKSDFVRVNTSTDAEECAPKELLEEIYDSIVKEEIKLKDDEVSALKSVRLRPGAERGLINILNLALPRGKSATDTKKESDDIVKRTQAFFKKQGKKRGIFYTAHQVELARPMLEAVGWPLLAAFSVTMEDSDNKPRVVSCMEGFRAGIHLTYVLGMDTMRYAFLTSLVRFTFLHAPKEMRTKNVESLRTLLALCDIEMESLQDTWNAVLECVSRLDYITSTPSISVTVMHGSNQISKDAVLLSLKELAGKPSDQLFINSVKLPSDSVVEFFTALCGVSSEELKQTPARVFSLQKLVEISYYNMARIRMVWARIWSILSQHFISAGSHREEKVAMYAIDSLRQLGMKYLERAELTNFTFQNDILKPFVILMRSSRNQSIRRLIVDCIVQMTKSKVGSIKSGWRSVFMIFTAASDDDSESIVESAFENVEQVILEHFDQVVGDCFMDCVNCLIGFANNKTSPRISLKAIALLRICEDRLAEGLIPGGALKPVTMGEDAIFDVTEHFWFPMLAGLSDLTSDPRLEVRNCALEVLFDLLNERGQKFSSAFWENIFHRVLFPIFNYIRYTGKDDVTSDDEWLRENSIHSLQLLCNLFNTFYKDVCFMLPSLLGLLLDCAKKADQSVVSLSLGALVHLVEVGGHQFSDDDWDTLLISIRDATYATQPLELLNSLGFEVSKSPRLLSKKSVDTIQKLDLRSAEDGEAEISHFNENEQETSNGSFLTEDSKSFGRSTSLTTVSGKHHGDELSASLAEPEGSPSPTGKVIEQPEVGNLGRSQTFGQRIMGNMMDTLLLKNLTMKPKNRPSDAFVPSSPAKVSDAIDTEPKDVDHPLLETIRGKCITQLLMLGAIDSMQRKYWNKLKISHRVTIMEILLSVLDFSSSYNSFANLRVRINQMPSERPPLNLLRQEITGTGIYLDVLYKATSTETRLGEPVHSIDSILVSSDKDKSSQIKVSKEEEEFCDLAEGKLVSFCEQILKEVSDLQDNRAEATNVDIHSVLELRSPVIVKVLRGMSMMNRRIFKKHLRELYPLITKLVCCDQMDIRGALGDLFNAQLTSLLP